MLTAIRIVYSIRNLVLYREPRPLHRRFLTRLQRHTDLCEDLRRLVTEALLQQYGLCIGPDRLIDMVFLTKEQLATKAKVEAQGYQVGLSRGL